jgi:hypothetical protein
MLWHSVNAIDFFEQLMNHPQYMRDWYYAVLSQVPLKEIQESFEFVSCIDSYIQGKRVLELFGGHGLVGFLLVQRGATSVHMMDRNDTHAHQRLELYFKEWTRCTFDQLNIPNELEYVHARAKEVDLVVTMHACGGLTDIALNVAALAGIDAVCCPCCYDHHHVHGEPQTLELESRMNHVDRTRQMRMDEQGYSMKWLYLDPAITPMNHVLAFTKLYKELAS